MWCDNCLLVLPLRAGAIAWAVVIAVYSLAGGIFLFRDGPYLFFDYPEWQIYGGISMGVLALAVLTAMALSNKSYIWIRVCKFLWPFVIVLCAIRIIIMMIQLHRGESNIEWECDHGGQLWTDSANAGYYAPGTFPSAFCAAGLASLQTAFVISLLVDLVFQLYMFFLTWRFSKRLEHYADLKGPFSGGYYA
jgi:hypothetical protein